MSVYSKELNLKKRNLQIQMKKMIEAKIKKLILDKINSLIVDLDYKNKLDSYFKMK